MGVADLIGMMSSDTYAPFPFMPPMPIGAMGPFFEVRSYLLQTAGLAKTIELWQAAVPDRAKLSPLLAAMYSLSGGLPRFMHIWPGRTIECIAIGCHVVDADGNDVTAAQLAVNRQIEQRKISSEALHLQLGPVRPNVARPERWLRANELPFVPRRAVPGPHSKCLMVIHLLSPWLRDREHAPARHKLLILRLVSEHRGQEMVRERRERPIPDLSDDGHPVASPRPTVTQHLRQVPEGKERSRPDVAPVARPYQ